MTDSRKAAVRARFLTSIASGTMFRSSSCLVRRMFLPFYSKERGPPMIRQQVVGTKARRFYKLVACNQKDPQQGKHMEVSIVPTAEGLKV